MLHLVNKASLPYDNISLLKQHSYHFNKFEWWGIECCHLEIDNLKNNVSKTEFDR